MSSSVNWRGSRLSICRMPNDCLSLPPMMRTLTRLDAVVGQERRILCKSAPKWDPIPKASQPIVLAC